MADAGERPKDSAKAKADATALAEQAEAEAAEAEALAAAARARARAIKLRREAQAQADQDAEETSPVVEAADDTAETPESPRPSDEPKPTGRRLPAWLPTALAAAAIVAVCALLGASGWMLWRHHTVQAERQRSAAYIAAAKQGVINLTSLDFKKSKADVQRIIDSATGEFRDQFQKTADDFASVVKDTKAVAEGSVGAAAIESMNKDSAVVLVLANERVTNIAGAKESPRAFRFRVSVVRDGDQLKLSKVEFVI
jgi:Mce-associated membrane protein